MSFIDEYRGVAEFLYFLSWPFIALTLIVSALQLLAFKKEAKIRFQRETISISIEILEKKLYVISNYFHDAFQNGSWMDPEPEGKCLGMSLDECTVGDDWKEWFQSEDSHVHRRNVFNAINELETLAQYVYSGVTDEELCYKLEHIAVVEYIEDLKFYIAMERKTKDDHMYENVVKIYHDWSSKMKHDKNTKEIEVRMKQNSMTKRPQSNKVLGL